MNGDVPCRNDLTAHQWDSIYWGKDMKDPPFHVPAYHKVLLHFYDLLFEKGIAARVFLPLCGKTMDMLYLAEQGHEVVGLEFSKIAVDSFFNENKLEFTESDMADAPFIVYRAKEKNITIYRGDLFDMHEGICGKFDAFWDRGSFVAINMSQRRAYTDLMFSLMKPSSKYLLQVMSYDGAKYSGPPHFVTKQSLKETFGRQCSLELLETQASTPPPVVKCDMEWTIFRYLIMLK